METVAVGNDRNLTVNKTYLSYNTTYLSYFQHLSFTLSAKSSGGILAIGGEGVHRRST